jgi:virulence factor
MTKSPRLRIGILGAGDIARKAYLPLLTSWPQVDIAGLCNRTLSTAQEVSQRWHLEPPPDTLETLLERRIDAAFVLTSTDSHEALIRRLLEAEVDVFVEKPATTHSQATETLADLAAERGRIFMIGFNRRFAPLYRQAKERFGERTIRMCLIEKHRPGAKERDLAGTYLDDTIHQIDLLRFLCGEVEPVATHAHSLSGRLLSAVSLARLKSGGQGVVLTSRQAGMWQERAYLHGDDLTVEVRAFRSLSIHHKDSVQVIGEDRAGRWFPQLVERGFAGEIEHFIDCVRSRRQPETNGEDAAKTQRLMEALVQAAEA